MASTISDIVGALGVTPEIALADATAIGDPTSANINAAVKAYSDNGQVIPTKMYAYLVQLNGERHPEDPVGAQYTPWLIAGGLVALYLLLFRK